MHSGNLSQVRGQLTHLDICVIITEHIEHLLAEHWSLLVVFARRIRQILLFLLFDLSHDRCLCVDCIGALTFNLVEV